MDYEKAYFELLADMQTRGKQVNLSEWPENLLLVIGLCSHGSDGKTVFSDEFPPDFSGTLDYVLWSLTSRERDVILSHYKDGKNYSEIGTYMHLSPERVRQIQAKAISKLHIRRNLDILSVGLREYYLSIQRSTVEYESEKAYERGRIEGYKRAMSECGSNIAILPEELDATSLESLSLSSRAYNCLHTVGVKNAGDIARMGCAKLLKLENLGKKTLEEIIDKMKELGWTLE